MKLKQDTGGIPVMKSKISILEFCSDTAALAVPDSHRASVLAFTLLGVLISALAGVGTHREA